MTNNKQMATPGTMTPEPGFLTQALARHLAMEAHKTTGCVPAKAPVGGTLPVAQAVQKERTCYFCLFMGVLMGILFLGVLGLSAWAAWAPFGDLLHGTPLRLVPTNDWLLLIVGLLLGYVSRLGLVEGVYPLFKSQAWWDANIAPGNPSDWDVTAPKEERDFWGVDDPVTGRHGLNQMGCGMIGDR
jgi:hypothetical protein